MRVARVFSQLLDIVFPPRETEHTVRTTGALPLSQNTYNGSTTLSAYSQTAVQAAIVENKYYNNEQAKKLLADLLVRWDQTNQQPLTCIPIPLSSKRLKKRGYNQVTEVLKKAKVPIVHALLRIKHTQPQTDLPKHARIHNVRNAFAVSNKIKKIEPGTTVVLIDDVVTTGATMQAARASLAPHLPPNCTIICLAFAH